MPLIKQMNRQRVVIEDLMQKDYSYFLTEPVGQNFQRGFYPEPRQGALLFY